MLPTLLVILTFLVLYWFPVRRWMAVIINAASEHVWPWLVQIVPEPGRG